MKKKSYNNFFKDKNIPIDEFLENVLYNKNFGYYAKKNPFGKNGDFVTSSSISILFSEMIAIWIISFWEKLGKPSDFKIVELGPGNGIFYKDLIKVFKRFPDFYIKSKFYLYEKSKNLEKCQKKILKGNKIKWLSSINQIKKGPVIFFGNEFFDAIPIKQFEKKDGLIYERFIKLTKNGFLKINLKKNKNNRKIKKFNTLKNLNFIEYPEAGFKELDVIVEKVKKLDGGLLLVDYGYIKQLNKNTIQSVMKHKKNNFLNNLGNADITYLVNFKLLEEYFLKKKLNLNKTVQQSDFLKSIGILQRAELLSKKMNFKDKSNLFFRVNRLINADQMGKIFKVILAYKCKKKILLGFN